jgi:DNA-binding Lrp family transcriptional regulator
MYGPSLVTIIFGLFSFLKELKKVEGVEEPFAVYGVSDIVARVKADTMERLKEIVTWRIRRLDKVRSTLTMIVVEEKQP